LKSPILFEFIKIYRLSNKNLSLEYIPSSTSYDWVKKNPILLKYKPINKEFKRIEEIRSISPEK
jgi:hypothetical protein